MKPRFYSKKAIGLLALFLSPFLACILFAYNLREIGKGKVGPLFILAGLFLPGLVRRYINITVGFQLAIVNVVGSVLLYFYFWDDYLSEYPDYEKKNFWKPTLFFLSVLITIFLLQFLVARKS